MASNKVPNRQVSLDSRRIRLEREVKIRVPQFDTFVTEYSSNISTTGMFILTNNPKPPGTLVTFEFSVADDWKLIRGQAQVVWVRHRAEGPEQPPGMGVRFVELDGQSRRLIRWIVEKHIREGGKPFELDELRNVIDEALDQVLDTEEAPAQVRGTTAPAPRATPVPAKTTIVQKASRSRSDSQLMPLLITAVVVVALVGLLFWLTEYLPRSGGDEEAAAAETAAIGEGEETGGAPRDGGAGDLAAGAVPTAGASIGPDGGGGTGESAGSAPVGSAYTAVTDLVQGWSDAWSDQDVDRYLSFYASSFRPPSGASRRAWAAQRRDRIAGPEYIRIAISGLEIDRVDDGRVIATFFQGYRSDRFNDEVRKRLELVWEEGAWRIRREVTL